MPAVRVLDVTEGSLVLDRLRSVPPTARAAVELGRRLARTHLAGAPAYGVGPEGWEGDGFFGPLSDPLPMVLGEWATWGAFYAEARVAPLVRLARDADVYDAAEATRFDRLVARLVAGELDTGEPVARLHGDLWSGNVMWTEDGAVLIDPAAHGGHHETDLALLALFGAPHLDEIRAGYQQARPLVGGWHARLGVHQLHCLLVHAVVYGGGYAQRAMEVTDRWARPGAH